MATPPLTIELTRLSRELAAMAASLARPAELYQVAGRALHQDLRKHFKSKDQAPNKMGGQRTYFWSQVRDSTQLSVQTDGAEVAINDLRFAQRLYGGVIRAKNKRALTIPISPVAYGKPAAAFRDLIRISVVDGDRVGFLARKDGDALEFLYVLRTRTKKQDPDPTALPSQDALEASVRAAALRFVARQTASPGA